MGEKADEATVPTPAAPDFERLPGLFRRWEINQLLEAGEIYRIEDAGTSSDGTALFAVYRRLSADEADGRLQ